MALHGMDIEVVKKRAAERLAKSVAEFEKSATDYQKKFYSKIPTRYRRGWLAAFLGVATKRAAIAAKCHDCVAFESVQENVGDCRAMTCPLWKYRPHQKKKGGKQ